MMKFQPSILTGQRHIGMFRKENVTQTVRRQLVEAMRVLENLVPHGERQVAGQQHSASRFDNGKSIARSC
jgi:hypothetical protein